MRRPLLKYTGIALAVFTVVGCYRAGASDDAFDSGTDTDVDAGADCLPECAACVADGTPCCGEVTCQLSTMNQSLCQPSTFTDTDLCAGGVVFGPEGEPCEPVGLVCIDWHETDSGGDEADCTCQGWDYWVLD